MKIRELTLEEMPGIWPLVKALNKELTRKKFDALLPEMLKLGYRCVGAFENTQCIGILGFWLSSKFWCGNYIEPDNFIVLERYRSAGVGKKLLDWVEQEGRRLGCDVSILDSYTTGHAAHRFYFREGYLIKGYHFYKKLEIGN